MKKIIFGLTLVLFPCLGWTNTAKYPASLNKGVAFTKYEDFNNMYVKIYKDVDVEDIDELIMRTLDSEDFTMEERKQMGQGIPALENIYKNASQAKQKEESEKIRQRIEFEQQVLRQENDIKRQASLLGIFYNGNHEKDAPFDLVTDLNQIDAAFVGKKATEPDPVYTHIKFEDKSALAPEERETIGSTDLEEEDSFAQRSDSLDPASPYDANDGSIAGSLENITNESWKKLDAVALAVENQSRNLFHSAHTTGGVPIPSFPFPGISSQPPENTEESDSTKVKQNTAAENIVSRIKQVFNQDTSEALAVEKSDSLDRGTVLGWIGNDIGAKQQELQKFLDMWDWISLNTYEEARNNQMNESLDQFNVFLESFRDESDILLQWSKKLANKPAL
jgi:hypothetical protein